MTVHTSAKGTQHETVYMYTAYCNSVQCNTSLFGTYDTISMAVHKNTHTHTHTHTYYDEYIHTYSLFQCHVLEHLHELLISISGVWTAQQQTNRLTNKQTNKQVNKQTNKQVNKQTNKQVNKQRGIYISGLRRL